MGRQESGRSQPRRTRGEAKLRKNDFKPPDLKQGKVKSFKRDPGNGPSEKKSLLLGKEEERGDSTKDDWTNADYRGEVRIIDTLGTIWVGGASTNENARKPYF